MIGWWGSQLISTRANHDSQSGEDEKRGFEPEVKIETHLVLEQDSTILDKHCNL